MKQTILKSLSLLGISLVLAVSVTAQEGAKVKASNNEIKYKSENDKIKDKKDETKYKSDDVKVKDKKDETKYKTADMKVKDKKDERKIKGKVRPMQLSTTERTEMKTGETQVQTKEQVTPVNNDEVVTPEPIVTSQVAVPTPVVMKSTAPKKTTHRRIATRKPHTGPKYIVRTKYVKDTVYVASPPERVVSTEYVHDTVSMTRVDTVVKTETKNTYNGYAVPRGNFKKVKLTRTKDGDVLMKRKEENGKTKTEKLKME